MLWDICVALRAAQLRLIYAGGLMDCRIFEVLFFYFFFPSPRRFPGRFAGDVRHEKILSAPAWSPIASGLLRVCFYGGVINPPPH